MTKVAPHLVRGQRVLYLGDWGHCAHQIETANRRTLVEHSGLSGRWERVALNDAQVEGLLRDNPNIVIQKPDRRHRPVQYFDAVETEALGQANIVAAVRRHLDSSKMLCCCNCRSVILC